MHLSIAAILLYLASANAMPSALSHRASGGLCDNVGLTCSSISAECCHEPPTGVAVCIGGLVDFISCGNAGCAQVDIEGKSAAVCT